MVRSLREVLPVVRKIVGWLLLSGIAVWAVAQSGAKPAPAPVPAKEYGNLHLETNIGSFRVMGPGPDTPAEGHIEISFTGSLLVSQLEGKVTTSGNLVKEYDAAKRQVYFGTGSIVVDGKFRKIQWFGRNMKADFRGIGSFLVFGEFDQNLETGSYYYNDPAKPLPWGQHGQGIQIPSQDSKVIKPIERGKSGGG